MNIATIGLFVLTISLSPFPRAKADTNRPGILVRDGDYWIFEKGTVFVSYDFEAEDKNEIMICVISYEQFQRHKYKLSRARCDPSLSKTGSGRLILNETKHTFDEKWVIAVINKKLT